MIALDEREAEYLDVLAAKIAQAVAARQAFADYLYYKYKPVEGWTLDLKAKGFVKKEENQGT